MSHLIRLTEPPHQMSADYGFTPEEKEWGKHPSPFLVAKAEITGVFPKSSGQKGCTVRVGHGEHYKSYDVMESFDEIQALLLDEIDSDRGSIPGTVTQSTIKVDGELLRLLNTDFTNANILDVFVGSTGYRGGDSGHGGRALFEIKDSGSTDLRVGINGSTPESIDSIRIMVGGDAEMTTLQEALHFGAAQLKRMNSLPQMEPAT